jgi:hypothetical protein
MGGYITAKQPASSQALSLRQQGWTSVMSCQSPGALASNTQKDNYLSYGGERQPLKGFVLILSDFCLNKSALGFFPRLLNVGSSCLISD